MDHIRYDILAQDALRGVVRQVLADAAKNGLPGEHHFYISFDTRHSGVDISQRLHDQYPEEMTIVLQHQFWDLSVSEDTFEVGASFGGVPERLIVPFAAINRFSDPSVQFGLQFELLTPGEDQTAGETASTPPSPAPQSKPEAGKVKLASVRSKKEDGSEQPSKASSSGKSDGEKDPPPTGGGEVVRLDRFRKK
jgi:hypothetical protein